jgi:dihydropteroate synthase
VITLRDLASLHEEHADDLARPVSTVTLGNKVTVGGERITLMGTINLSRDSTYRESVAVSAEAAVRMGRVQIAQGASIIDVGAEASHAQAELVGASAQIEALVPVVRALSAEAVVSVETYDPDVVAACLDAGARLLNMTGREHQDEMLRLAARHDAGVVLCYGELANVRHVADSPGDADPLPALVDHFSARLDHARGLGVTRLMVDPGMGFHYGDLTAPLTRSRYQSKVLAHSFRLRSLGVPVCTVLPHSFDIFEAEFRKAEGFYAALAALGGAHLLRVHEVAHVRAVLHAMHVLDV